MTFAHLSIGTADSRIDLLNDHGYYAQDWTPKAGSTEDTFAASALADYRQLTSYRELTTIESIPLTLKQASQDDTIQATQDLRRILRAARDYWATRHQPDPVYLQAQASCETNARYAIIHAGDVPQDSNPYGEPFLQAGKRALMLQTLVLERGPWLEAAPGTATCALAAGYQPDFLYPWYVIGYLSGCAINCGSDASLDDLHAAAMTAEGWFYISSNDANDRIITKAGDAVDVGWIFYFSAAGTLTFRVNYDTTDSIANYAWTPDSTWHHWACTYNNGGDAKARIWLDGVLVATAAAATAGAVDTDAANDLIINNRASYDAGPVSSVGWVRVSSSERYTIAFTAPARCKLPDVDAATELLVIHEGTGGTTYDLSGNGNDGTLVGFTWRPDCVADYGHTTLTCDADTLFVTNKNTNAQLTHIYHYDDDAATWSGNLQGNALPYDLLPAAPAADDIVYFGIDSTAIGGGPFSSLVLDLVAATNITTAVWEYWNGAAWATLTTQDNTNILKASGIKSVHWSQPSDWAAVDLVTAVGAGAPVISAWWVRMRITVAGAATAPEAQNRQPYTVNWPWLEIEAGQVPGDFDALLKAILHCKSDDDAATAPELYFNQAIVGLRSGDRAEVQWPATAPVNSNFWPYINATDNSGQNSIPITCAVAGTGAFAARSDSPTGEIVRATNPGAAWATVWRIWIEGAYQAIYRGIYHAFLRAEMTSGATGDIKVRYVTSFYPIGGAASTTYTSKAVNVPARVTAGVYTAIDLGRMEIPPSDMYVDTERTYNAIEIQLYGNGAADLDICDLVIMPIDEWAVRVSGTSTTARVSAIEYNEYLTVDSITNPKVPIRAIHSTTGGPQYIQGIWSPAANGPAILHPNVKQRLYFFFPETEQSGGVLESRFEVCATAQLYRQARYMSMRGDR